jgi:DNA-binding PadR family transcriptional regulator
MTDLQRRILGLVAAHSGQYSWYQLDRCLSEAGAEHSGRLMPLLRELISGGLIESEAGPNPSQPVYSITERPVQQTDRAETRRRWKRFVSEMHCDARSRCDGEAVRAVQDRSKSLATLTTTARFGQLRNRGYAAFRK